MLFCHVKAHPSACLSLCLTASVVGKATGSQEAFPVEPNIMPETLSVFATCDTASLSDIT